MYPRLLGTMLACALVALAAAPPAPAEAHHAGHSMLRAINEYRAAHGVPALQRSRTLERSALRYARRSLRRDRVAHMGIAPSRRFRRVGENLEWHPGRRVRTRHALDGWIASPSHRALLLSRSFRWAGARPARGALGSRRAVVWVLHLGGR